MFRAVSAPNPPAPEASEKKPRGSILYVKLKGTIDQSFDGQAIGVKAKGKILILDLADVKRVSSSGLRGWMALVSSHEPTYLVECSPHVVSQINVMAGLAGLAKVVSFYATYRCGPCSREFDVLFLLPRDRVIIRELTPAPHACPKCGTMSDLDDEPASFLGAIAKQAVFDLDDEVTTFLRTRLRYDLTVDSTALHVFQYSQGKNVYIRVTGNIDRSFPTTTVTPVLTGDVVLDLSQAALVDSGGVSQLRALLRQVRTSASSLDLLDCPSVYFERVVLPEDLEKWLKIISLAVTYECGQCQGSVVRLLDVNAHLGPLRSAAMPPLECVHCKTPMVAQVSETMTTMLRRLPKPELTPSRESFVKKAKKLPAKRLQNVLSPKPQRNAVPFLLRVSFITLGVAIAILVTEAVIAHRVYKHQTGVAGVVPGSQTDARPRYERPAWIIGGTGTAYCHDLINRFTCVGSSFYNPNRDDALGEATNAAMDELATAIGLKIDDPRFQEHTLAHYQAERSKALIAVDADVEPGNADYQQAREQVLDARERVANALKASGGTAIPAQRTDWYWEEYEADAPGTTEFLVFVRYDIGLDAIRALVSRYTLPVDVLGSSAVSAFPELAWRLKGFDGGVMIHQARGALAATGLRPGQIVTKVGGEPVHDPAALAQRLKKVGVGERVALTVLNISGATTSVEFEGK